MEPSTYRKSPDPSSLLLALLILMATFITILCVTPPNPVPSTSSSSQPADRIKWATEPLFLFASRLILLLLGGSHALITLTYSSATPESHIPTTICPNVHHLSPTLFTFSTYSITLLLLILAFGSLRISCFHTLGPNFTFQLATPGKLTTTGLYAYMQHPSYTFLVIVSMAYGFLTLRRDGAVGCWLPEWMVQSENVGTCLKTAVGGGVAGGLWQLGVRVKDEERMLRERFGRAWEIWHGRTRRFVPGVF